MLSRVATHSQRYVQSLFKESALLRTHGRLAFVVQNISSTTTFSYSSEILLIGCFRRRSTANHRNGRLCQRNSEPPTLQIIVFSGSIHGGKTSTLFQLWRSSVERTVLLNVAVDHCRGIDRYDMCPLVTRFEMNPTIGWARIPLSGFVMNLES